MSEIKAGPELDASVARALGWSTVHYPNGIPFHPSTSLVDAWSVVEKMKDRGPCVNFIKNKWHCAIGTGEVEENVDVEARTISYGEKCVHGWADTAQLAICLAALACLSARKEGRDERTH